MAELYAPDCGDFCRELLCRKNSPVSGLCALRELDFDHLDARKICALRKFFDRKSALLISTTEVARTDLPNEVSAALLVIRRKPPFTGIMSKSSELRAFVQCENRVFAECSVAHRRNIEHRGGVR